MSKRVVLSEEDYVKGLSEIIKRDFYPDLPRDSTDGVQQFSLESFQNQFTSEDNASFMKLSSKETKESNKGLAKRGLPMIQEGQKNALFFPPKAITPGVALSRSNEKAINVKATRLPEIDFPDESSIDGRSTFTAQYSMVESTPRLVPGVDVELMETWGTLEGTPVRIDSPRVSSGMRPPLKTSGPMRSTMRTPASSTPLRTPGGSTPRARAAREKEQGLTTRGQSLLNKITR